MKYKLLVRKLEVQKARFIKGSTIKEYCKALHMSYASAISYLLSNRYLVRILRGIFYRKSMEERKLKMVSVNYLYALREALAMKGIKNWYFGMESALKMNSMTHEYFTCDVIISDKIYRPKPFEILGHTIKFIKIKKSLVGFGIKKGSVNYSDKEKTILDMIYFGKYNHDEAIKSTVLPYIKECSAKMLMRYAMHYPKSVMKVVEEFI